MPNIGPVELIIILVIALLILGPGRLPDVGSALGKSIREFRKAATDVQDSVKLDAAPAPAPAPPAAPAPLRPRPRPRPRTRWPRPPHRTRWSRHPRSRPPPPLSRSRRREPREPGLARRGPPLMAESDLPRDGGSALLPVPAAAPPLPSLEAPPPAPDAAVMPLFDHLAELRRRIAVALLAVVVGLGRRLRLRPADHRGAQGPVR